MTGDTPLTIGLTGNIGSGKSTVARHWAEHHDCAIIDGDQLGREVVDQSPDYRRWLRDRFGSAVFDGDTLLRAELGKIVFADSRARDEMNEAIWPHIRQLLERRIGEALAGGRHALVDAAMIFEWGDEARYDVLVAVIVDPELGARRAAARMGRPAGEMLQRYRMQLPAELKARRSDLVLRNDGSLAELLDAAGDAWPRLFKLARR